MPALARIENKACHSREHSAPCIPPRTAGSLWLPAPPPRTAGTPVELISTGLDGSQDAGRTSPCRSDPCACIPSRQVTAVHCAPPEQPARAHVYLNHSVQSHSASSGCILSHRGSTTGCWSQQGPLPAPATVPGTPLRGNALPGAAIPRVGPDELESMLAEQYVSKFATRALGGCISSQFGGGAAPLSSVGCTSPPSGS